MVLNEVIGLFNYMRTAQNQRFEYDNLLRVLDLQGGIVTKNGAFDAAVELEFSDAVKVDLEVDCRPVDTAGPYFLQDVVVNATVRCSKAWGVLVESVDEIQGGQGQWSWRLKTPMYSPERMADYARAVEPAPFAALLASVGEGSAGYDSRHV